MPPPRDTTAQAYAIQTAILRSLTPAEKFQAACEMSNFTHELALAGLRRQRPELTESELPRVLAELLYPPRKAR